MRKIKFTALGIDPGLSGAFLAFDGKDLESHDMPIVTNGKDRMISFDGVYKLLDTLQNKYPKMHIYLERAVPMAMGAKSAFNYGQGFAALLIAIELLQIPFTLVEPQKWAKEMHEGISTDLKPKAKSLVAVQRLYPKLIAKLPKNTKGKLQEGPMDALLIAAYGLRKNGVKTVKEESEDFF